MIHPFEAFVVDDQNWSDLFRLQDTYPGKLEIWCKTTEDGAVTNRIHSVQIIRPFDREVAELGDTLVLLSNGEFQIKRKEPVAN